MRVKREPQPLNVIMPSMLLMLLPFRVIIILVVLLVLLTLCRSTCMNLIA